MREYRRRERWRYCERVETERKIKIKRKGEVERYIVRKRECHP